MNDNDVVKTLLTIPLSIVAGVVFGLAFTEINGALVLSNEQRLYTFVVEFEGSDLEIMVPKLGYIMIYYLPFVVFFYGRMLISTFQLRRKAKDNLTRAGLGYIFLAVLGNMLIMFFFGTYILFYNYRNTAMLVTFFTLKTIAISISVVYAHFGFIMPNWLKSRIRGKSYFEKIYTSKLKPALDSYAYSTGGNEGSFKTTKDTIISDSSSVTSDGSTTTVEVTEA